MSRPPRTVIEYRNYELPADFPIQMLSGENWRISDVPSGVLHFHNCLEIGLCESDGGFLGFRGEQRAFRAGDVTIISGGAVAGPVHAGRDAAAPDGLCDQRAGAVRGAGR